MMWPYNHTEFGYSNTTSAPHHDLKEVEIDVLPEEGMDQHEQHWNMTSDVPRPHTPPPNHHR